MKTLVWKLISANSFTPPEVLNWNSQENLDPKDRIVFTPTTRMVVVEFRKDVSDAEPFCTESFECPLEWTSQQLREDLDTHARVHTRERNPFGETPAVPDISELFG